jgi:hypothetical protein
MNFSELSLEVTVALLSIVTIAIIGCITALYSWNRISAEQKGIRDAESKLISDNSWNDAYPHDKLLLATWLRSHGIKPDSHIGDFIRTCWSAWLGGRTASLTELHTLVARRERSHKATRLSAGIAGLLLVFGIVGTLSAVKPVLENFQIQVAKQSVDPSQNQSENEQLDQNLDDNKDAAFVAENAVKVNSLIRNLGGAFFPSLLALIGTIFVVTCRGIYSQALYKFILELDRFAIDTLIPRYRIIPISEQFEEIKTSMSQLTETIIQRESNFENVVVKLDNLVSNIAPALAGLDGAAKASLESVEALTKGSASIADALNQHLGARSSIHRAIKGLDKTYADVESWFKELASISETINKSNATSKKQLNDAIIALAGFLNKSVQDFEVDREKIVDAIDDLKNELIGIPDQIKTTGENATKQAIKVAETASQDLQKKFYESNSRFIEAVKTTITTEVRKFDKVSTNLNDQSAKIETSIRSLNEVKKDIKKSIEEATSAGVKEIKDITTKAPAEVSPNSSNLSKSTKKQEAVDEWEEDNPVISHKNQPQNHYGKSTPEKAITPTERDDQVLEKSERMVVDSNSEENEQIVDTLTAENENTLIEETNTDMSESNASKHASVAAVSPDAEKAMNTHKKTQLNPEKSIEGITAPQRSKKSWWPFSKR